VMSVELHNGRITTMSHLEFWKKLHTRSTCFTPSRCLLCCDGTAELADISFGDAWLPEFSNDNNGTSIIVSRTQMAEQFLQKAMSSKKIKLSKITGIKVARSQGMMRFKKNSLAVRFLFFGLSGEAIPKYYTKMLKPGFIDYPRSGVILVNQYLASKPRLWGVLQNFIRLQNPLKKAHTIALAHTLPKHTLV